MVVVLQKTSDQTLYSKGDYVLNEMIMPLVSAAEAGAKYCPCKYRMVCGSMGWDGVPMIGRSLVKALFHQ